MSGKPTFIRVKRFRPVDKNNTRHSQNSTYNSEDTRLNDQTASIHKIKISSLKAKTDQLATEISSTSRTRLSGFHTSKAVKKFSLSMYSPISKTPRTSRARVSSMTLPPTSNIEYPITPLEAVDRLRPWLTEGELSEIFEFKEIYFLGTGAKKIHSDPSQVNFGYDNDKGEYKLVCGDHIYYRYQILAVLGTGSFGQVCKCLDHKTKEIVAVKIIKNKKKFHKQGMVEIKLLQRMKENDPNDVRNIVRIKGHFLFRNHLCIVFELLSINLYELMKLNKFQRLPLNVVHRFAVQLLTGLEYAASMEIVHCDLKPENILLRQLNKSAIKIIDFGSGCYENERIYTYIQSRFYRAPEIMLGIPYTCSIDIWSLGCILVELHIGIPLFPGENENEQFLRIMEVIGLPPADVLEYSSRKKMFFEGNRPKIIPNSRGKIRFPGTKTLENIISTDDWKFVEFIKELLVWNPKLRLTAREALKHPWIVQSLEKTAMSCQRKKRLVKSFIDPRDVEVFL